MEEDDNDDDDAYMNNNHGLLSGKNNNKRGRGSSSSREWADRNDDMGDDMDEGAGLGQGRSAKHGRKNSTNSDGGDRFVSSISGGGNSRSANTTSVLSNFVREKKNEKRSIRK